LTAPRIRRTDPILARKCHAPNALNNLATGLVRLSILGLFQSSSDPKLREAPMSSVIVEKNAPGGEIVLRARPFGGFAA
jgi:hypothetical protein